MKLQVCINNYLVGKSVKDILKNSLNLSSRLIIKLKKHNQIYCNNKPCYTNHIVKLNDIICVNIHFVQEDNIIPVKYQLDILYEDEYLLIVNKEPGIPTHPSMKHFNNTLSNYVKAYYLDNNIYTLIRPVNRLDKDTSGIVIFAKNQHIQECLIRQMNKSIFKKYYTCIISGILFEKEGIISLPIARMKDSIIKRCVDTNGQIAITNYIVEKEFDFNNDKYSLLNIYLQTGRTHQIRVHFSHIGHPLLGDSLYGTYSKYIFRQALHCTNVEFIHPINNNIINIVCPLPNDINNILN